MKDRMLSHGVTEGLRGFLMKGRNPAGLLHLHIDPAEVDVNVHPTKQEVRFRASRDMHQLIVQTIQETMQAYQSTLRNSFFKQKEAATPVRQATMTPSPIKPVASYIGTTAEPVPGGSTKHAQSPLPVVESPSPVRQQPAFTKKQQQGHGLKVIGQFNNLYIFCQSRSEERRVGKECRL